MKMVKALSFFSIIIIWLSGCSPFAGDSVIKNLKGEIEAILNTKSSMEIVAGGTNIVETNPGNPAQNYKVKATIGQFMNQSTFQTSGGYKVQSTVISE